MRFQGEEDADIIDGEVVGRSEPQVQQWQGRSTPGPQQIPVDPYVVAGDPGGGYAPAPGIDLTGLVDVGVNFASQQQTRSLALLVKVPLFAYVALHRKMPLAVRLGAAAFGVMEFLEALQRAPDYEQLVQGAQLPPMPGE